MKRLDATLDTLDELRVDAMALCIAEDARPLRGMAGLLDWRECGRISQLLVKDAIVGKDGEVALTLSAHPGVRRIVVFGFGPEGGMVDRAAARFAHLVDVLEKAKVDSVVVDLPHPGEPLWGRAEKALSERLGKKLVGVFSPEERWAPKAGA